MTASVAFVEVGPAGGHARLACGLTVLERCVRAQAKAGATRVVVAATPIAFARELPIAVEWVAPGTPAPADATVVRGDVLAEIEVVDAASLARAEWAHLRRMNKSFEGPVDALLNWRFSMRLTRALSRTRLTPNHVTLAAIAVGVVAGVLAVQGQRATTALAGVLLQVNSILDSCDGELARLRFQYSKVGQWLDNLADDVVDNLFIACTGLALGGPWAWLGVGTAAGRAWCSITIYRDVYARTGTGDVFAFRYWFERPGESTESVYDPRKVTTWLRAMGRRDTYVFVWMIACVAGFPQWVIGHALVIGTVAVATLAAHLWIARAVDDDQVPAHGLAPGAGRRFRARLRAQASRHPWRVRLAWPAFVLAGAAAAIAGSIGAACSVGGVLARLLDALWFLAGLPLHALALFGATRRPA